SDDAAALGETIAALMPEHPARALAIRLSGAGPRALTQRVYQQCWKPFGQRQQICCEQVEITASDAALADLPPLLLALAVPDLPLIVWCRSPKLARISEVRAEFGGEFGVSAWLMGAWVANALRDAGVDARLTVSRAEAVSAADTPSLRLELAGPEIHVRLARRQQRLVITVNDL